MRAVTLYGHFEVSNQSYRKRLRFQPFFKLSLFCFESIGHGLDFPVCARNTSVNTNLTKQFPTPLSSNIRAKRTRSPYSQKYGSSLRVQQLFTQCTGQYLDYTYDKCIANIIRTTMCNKYESIFYHIFVCVSQYVRVQYVCVQLYMYGSTSVARLVCTEGWLLG